MLTASIHLSSAFADDWLTWRGPTNQGHSSAVNLPQVWSETDNVAWKQALPGRGHSTPLIYGDMLWLTTAMETPASPEEIEAAKEIKRKGGQPKSAMAAIDLKLLGIDRKIGAIAHVIDLFHIDRPAPVHLLNSYATPTPIIADGRLYASFGSFGSVSVDLTNRKVLWQNHELTTDHDLGPGSSPVLWNDRLIIPFDGIDSQFIAALDTNTGKVAWKSQRSGELSGHTDTNKAYGTPFVVDVDNKPVVISHAASWVYGYDPRDGRELWKLPYGGNAWSTSLCVVGQGNQVFVGTSYGKSQLLGIDLGAGATPSIRWRNAKSSPKMSSPVVFDDLIFYMEESGIAVCIDAKNGNTIYRERVGGKFSASPIVSEGKIYYISQQGNGIVLPASRDCRLLGESKLDGTFMASPIAVNDSLYFRSETTLYCLRTLATRKKKGGD